MDNTSELTVLSLCTGYGGIELGLAAALQNPLRVVAVEVEAYALANLAAKAEEGELVIEAMWPDLRTFPAERFRGCFDFILAGYPCQGESFAGKRLKEKDPRWLWPHIERIIEAVQPVWFFGENVPGHLSGGFPTVYRSLQNLGYRVEAGLFTAAEVGAPHKRQRLFILANNSNSRREDGQIQQTRQSASWHSSKILWPARPGQPQYKWEEPRIVVHAGRGRYQQPAKEVRAGRNAAISSDERQTQSRLGRAVNGPGSRMDKSKSGVKNEKVLSVQQANSWEEQVEQKVLQQPVLRQSNNEKTTSDDHKTETLSKENESRNLRKMPKSREHPKTPSRQEQRQSDDIMPEMPHKNTSGKRNLGQQEKNGMRIDRLRLLGNGVVPEQAAKAFINLMEKF